MNETPDILCIGSVLWDVIGHSASHMRLGSDVPGRISRQPGGVAMNIAMTLRRFGMRPALLTTIGRDSEGQDLLATCRQMGLITRHVYLSEDLPTDRYIAIEAANGLIAAIADAHSLEAAADKILRPLLSGPLGDLARPYPGVIALDGNLMQSLLEQIAHSAAFSAADLRVAPASPGKAERLAPLLGHPRATFYVNIHEAGLLCQRRFDNAADAARALCQRGATRVLVTDGGNPVSLADETGVLSLAPPDVLVTRVTGAGDTFMAAHIVAETRNETRAQALQTALRAAADFVSGETPL